MPEGDYVKSDGDVLFASEFNDARGNADVNLFTDPVSNLKGIVSATGVNTLAFPRTKRNFIYELIADDVANTTTGLTHDDARDTYQGGVGSAVTYISQTLFASETINSATINYDAEIINIGDEVNNSAVDAAWTADVGTVTEGATGIVFNVDGGNDFDGHFAKDAAGLTNPLFYFRYDFAGGGTRKLISLTNGTTAVTIKDFGSTAKQGFFVLSVDSTAETANLYFASQSEKGSWSLEAENIDISSITTYFLRFEYNNSANTTLSFLRIFASSTTGSLTFEFSANSGTAFTTMTNGRANTIGSSGIKPVFKITSTGMGSNEYVLIHSASARYLS